MKFPVFSIFIATGIALSACSKSDNPAPIEEGKPTPEQPKPDEPDEDGNQEEIPTTTYNIRDLDYSQRYTKEPVVTTFAHQTERELSGVTASRINPDVLYMHGDSKNSAILITNTAGADLGRIVLEGQSTLDPEDIAVGPGPEEGKSYIYFADIGDNDKVRRNIAVYRFEEPLITDDADEKLEIRVKDATKLLMNYPVSPYNAETLLVDPLTKDLYILTKETYQAKVFRAAYPQDENTVLEELLHMRSFDLFTAGDISVNGTEILLRNKSQFWYWKRSPEQSIVEAFMEAPLQVPYALNERQGEGIGFAADGTGFFTNSEVKDWPDELSKLSFYGLK